MKKIRTIISVIACMAFLSATFSCHDKDRAQEERPSYTFSQHEEKTNTAKSKNTHTSDKQDLQLLKMDSLAAEIISSKQEIERLNKSVVELKASVDSLQADSRKAQDVLWGIVGGELLIIILFVIILRLVARARFKKLVSTIQKRLDEERNQLLKIDASLSTIQKHLDEVRNLPRKTDASLPTPQKRLDEVKRQGNENVHNVPKQDAQTAKVQTIYYTTAPNDEGYFRGLFLHLKDNSIFQITLTSETEGTFTLISVDRIKSKEGWKRATALWGGVSLSEATGFTTTKHGVVSKQGDDTWKIEKKLEVTFTK